MKENWWIINTITKKEKEKEKERNNGLKMKEKRKMMDKMAKDKEGKYLKNLALSGTRPGV